MSEETNIRDRLAADRENTEALRRAREEREKARRDVPEFAPLDENVFAEQDAALELDGPPAVETKPLDLPFDGTVDFTGFLDVGLPRSSEARKNTPMATGLLDYFPDALAEVARVSKAGNDKHNPGEPLHWARGKSMDHADCIVRHLAERGARDLEGVRHSASVAWRALALLQEELEAEGAPLPRGAQEPEVPSCTYEDGQCHRMDCPC